MFSIPHCPFPIAHSLLPNMTTIGTKIYTLLYGKYVGTDQFGNRYYKHRKQDGFGRHKRWVVYHGQVEPSKIPPEWHGWMHYMLDIMDNTQYTWQKEYQPNVTGTKRACSLPKESASHKNYQSWQPDNAENT